MRIGIHRYAITHHLSMTQQCYTNNTPIYQRPNHHTKEIHRIVVSLSQTLCFISSLILYIRRTPLIINPLLLLLPLLHRLAQFNSSLYINLCIIRFRKTILIPTYFTKINAQVCERHKTWCDGGVALPE